MSHMNGGEGDITLARISDCQLPATLQRFVDEYDAVIGDRDRRPSPARLPA